MKRFLWPTIWLVLIAAYPLIWQTPFQQRLGALVLLYAIASSGWNILGGYAGQMSIGHVVFFGCGAYGALGAFQHLGLPPVAGLPIGVLAACSSPRSSGCRRCGSPGTTSAWQRSAWRNWCA